MEAAYPLIAFEEDELIVHKNWGKIVKKKKTSSTERKSRRKSNSKENIIKWTNTFRTFSVHFKKLNEMLEHF